MPLSRQRDRERKRRERALKREGGTVLLPASAVRRLKKQGLNITKALVWPSITLDDYRDLGRQLAAKVQRIEWQSSGIRMLRDQIATLEARLATFPAMQERELQAQLLATQQRVTFLEAAQAVGQAIEHSVGEV